LETERRYSEEKIQEYNDNAIHGNVQIW